MEWGAAHKYYQPSANGSYTVSAALTPNGWVFTAWRVQQPMSEALGYHDDPQTCRDLCDTDAQERLRNGLIVAESRGADSMISTDIEGSIETSSSCLSDPNS